MCKIPEAPKVKNIVPEAPDQPDKAPDPVKVGAGDASKRKRNPLRIDLAAGGGGGAASGATV